MSKGSDGAEAKMKHEMCGYSNCFRPFFKMRGFMPTCELHFKQSKKWPKDKEGNLIYTGSVWMKREGR